MQNYTTIGSALWSFFDLLLEAVAPRRRTEATVAALTLKDLEDLHFGEPLPYHDRRITALIWELKYRKNATAAALAGKYLSEILLAVAGEEIGKPLLIPVPMHAARKKERGYNQTELLCIAILSVLNENEGQNKTFEYVPNVLVRTRHTAPQQGLPKYERLKNVKNSMLVVRPEKVKGRVCVVVDDVTTTGATLAECKRALKAAGARAVHCIALARS